MKSRTAVDWGWLIFAAIILCVVVGGALAQSLCSGGTCVMPEADLRELLWYLNHLESIVNGKCV